MNKLIYLLFCFLFVCCSNNRKHNEVEIFNGLKFKLQEAEVQENINDVTKKNISLFLAKTKINCHYSNLSKAKTTRFTLGYRLKQVYQNSSVTQ